MTDLDITAIRERAEKTTKGPWKVYQDGILAGVADTDDAYVAEPPLTWNDAEFIAHAREDIPALLAEVERLQGEREEAYENWVGQCKLTDQYSAEAARLQGELAKAWDEGRQGALLEARLPHYALFTDTPNPYRSDSK